MLKNKWNLQYKIKHYNLFQNEPLLNIRDKRNDPYKLDEWYM